MAGNGKNRSELAALIKTQLPALLLFARQWPHDSPEDIVQEAFMRLLEQPVPPENVTAWLFTVVRNLSNNHIRSEKRRKNREIEKSSQNSSWFVAQDRDGETNDHHTELIEQLQQLPFQYREVIVAKIWGKLTFDQIAVIQETSTSSAHRIYQTGIKLLQEKLGSK
jgi:RNA polymerase sigma-70 factor (ECF subfamily)